MPAERCPLCGTRRARRACPALGREICPVCCGTKRLTEIACPADCGWLRSAEQHPPAIAQRRQERDLSFIYGALGSVTERQAHLLLYLQALVKRHATAASPAIADRDVAEAAGSLASTLETSAKGIIYEHRAGSIPAQRLAEELKRGLEERGRSEGPVPDREAAAALRLMQKLAGDAAAALGDGPQSYLGLIDRVMKPAAKAEGAPAEQSRIVLP
jgi:hypothetical protein